ncbi:CHAP domain-containing protein [Gordonia sp. NPDC003425]
MTSTTSASHNRRRWPRVAGAAILVAIVVGVGAVVAVHRASDPDGILTRAAGTPFLGSARPRFPAVDTAGLSPVRARIVAIVHAQYDENAPGTTYSDGVEESWCADFVSTTMRKAGVPFDNPNSGSWRIPGVATLTDYLHASGRWRPPTRTPEPGDIVLYDKPSHFRQHTNIVVARHGDTVTTVGGAEAQGVTLAHFDVRTVRGIQGYGVP